MLNVFLTVSFSESIGYSEPNLCRQLSARAERLASFVSKVNSFDRSKQLRVRFFLSTFNIRSLSCRQHNQQALIKKWSCVTTFSSPFVLSHLLFGLEWNRDGEIKWSVAYFLHDKQLSRPGRFASFAPARFRLSEMFCFNSREFI